MSLLVEKEIECLNCKFPNKVEVWSIVNVKEDPELKDLILGGELNMTPCQSCQKVFYAEHFVIYHDPDNELMAFVFPIHQKEEKERWVKKANEDFEATQVDLQPEDKLNYKPVFLFGLDELVKIIDNDESIKIQSEIVGILSKELGFLSKKIRPFVARSQSLPFVIPHEGGNGVPSRQALIGALKGIEQRNSKLNVYRDLLKRIEKDPSFQIQYE